MFIIPDWSCCVIPIMSHTRFKVNLNSVVAWMSRNSILETGATSDVWETITGFDPTTTQFVNPQPLSKAVTHRETVWVATPVSYFIFNYYMTSWNFGFSNTFFNQFCYEWAIGEGGVSFRERKEILRWNKKAFFIIFDWFEI